MAGTATKSRRSPLQLPLFSRPKSAAKRRSPDKPPADQALLRTPPAGPAPAAAGDYAGDKETAAPPEAGAIDHRIAEQLSRQQRDISVSEFFAKNRHLLGFDNKRKALLSTVKEAVDNSLDACEEAAVLPELEVRLLQTGEDRFRVTVTDNGPGIVKQQIPNIFAKLLYGSKFHRLRMSRGQQGIGISAAGMYGLLTTGRPVRITSRTGPRRSAHYYELAIDTKRNRPEVVVDRQVEVDFPHGTCVQIDLLASYSKTRQSVDEYLEQTAIANPHARIRYLPPSGGPVVFPRGAEALPARTREIKPHPHGIELGMLLKMLRDTKSKRLGPFLKTEFCRVTERIVRQVVEQCGLTARSRPGSINGQQVEKLYQALQKVKLLAPPTNCLAPIGARQLLAGLLKGVQAEFYTAAVRPPTVYRGNPFQIEAGLAFGGQLGSDGKRESEGNDRSASDSFTARVLRFANRVPLLYQQSACCIYKSVVDTSWSNYGLTQPRGSLPAAPVVILVHMASVWVPFTSESKEAIADYDEIRREIRLALQECGRKLAVYLRRRRRAQRASSRRGVFRRYIDEVVNALGAMTRVNRATLRRELLAISQKITVDADMELDDEGRPVALPPIEAQIGPDTLVVDRDTGEAPVPSSLFADEARAVGKRRAARARKARVKPKRGRRRS